MTTIIRQEHNLKWDPEERIRKDKENFRKKIEKYNKEDLKELLHKLKKELSEKEKEIRSSNAFCEIESLTLKIQVIDELLDKKENY